MGSSNPTPGHISVQNYIQKMVKNLPAMLEI